MCTHISGLFSKNRRLFNKTDCVSFDTFNTLNVDGLYFKRYSYVEPDVHRQQLYPSLKYISLKCVTMEISGVCWFLLYNRKYVMLNENISKKTVLISINHTLRHGF